MAIGLVPIDFENKGSESALSVYPVAIANCKEDRYVLQSHKHKKLANYPLLKTYILM